jgi:hypothetical protein
MTHENILFEDEMIRRKQGDNGIRIPLVNTDDGKEYSWPGVPVFRLNDDAFWRSRGDLMASLVELEVFLGDDSKESLRRD